MNRSPNFWPEWFMGLARYVASASKDPSTRVGSVIVDENRVVRGMGYNGFPRGVEDFDERYNDRPTKYKFVVHAEVNAVLNASRDVRGCTLYCTLFPCSECAKVIIQAGITVVYTTAPDPRWADSCSLAATMFAEAGVEVCLLDGTPA